MKKALFLNIAIWCGGLFFINCGANYHVKKLFRGAENNNLSKISSALQKIGPNAQWTGKTKQIYGHGPNSAIRDGDTPILVAAMKGNLDAVKELIRSGAEFDTVSSPALFYTIDSRHCLVQYKNSLFMVMSEICLEKKLETFHYLISAGADPNLVVDGKTPIVALYDKFGDCSYYCGKYRRGMSYSSKFREEILKTLLDADGCVVGKPNAFDYNGWLQEKYPSC